jgi:adenylate cyclase
MTDPPEETGGPEAQVARREAERKRMHRLREMAVRVDSSPAILSAVERLRRRAPGDERFGDRLSSTGDTPASLVARGVSALEPDRPSVLHEVGLGALQMWQNLSESAGRGRGEVEVSILFTDLVGFSTWALEAGDELALELLRDVGDAVEAAVFEARGQIVKRLGDGIMAVFDDAGDAVAAALGAQESLAGIEVGGYRPGMRAGVHHGRPRKLGNDYLGVDVNIAARVAEAAEAGEVLVSVPACERLDPQEHRTGRAKRLKAPGAPRELRVRPVGRAAG